MKSFILLASSLLALATAGIYLYMNNTSEMTPYAKNLLKIAEKINNNPNSTWFAVHNKRWDNQNEDSVSNFFIKPELSLLKSNNNLKSKTFSKSELEDLPKEFDTREAWSDCESTKEIRDQATCGSCWAFGAAEVITDRICIADYNGKKRNPRIAPEELLECCGDLCGAGCQGGWPDRAMEYWQRYGMVTGGLYGDTTTCKPYAFPSCAHHVKSDELAPCPSVISPTPKCSSYCANGENYQNDRYFAEDVYNVSGEENIMAEISKHGPVEITISVYEDFLVYGGGVYQHLEGESKGAHAMKMIGYGVTDKGVKYWIIANSWNYIWGEGGYLRFLRGDNHCGIEESVATGLPNNMF